jgi:hypothetical protein
MDRMEFIIGRNCRSGIDITGSSPAGSRIPRSCCSWCRIDGERLPRTLKLYSTMGVVTAFSGVQVTGPTGL